MARRYRFADGGGDLGVITSVSRPFCGDCTRARLGVDGKLFTCLFATSRVVGWTAHVLEALADLRIIRPASVWTGPEPGKRVVPLSKR